MQLRMLCDTTPSKVYLTEPGYDYEVLSKFTCAKAKKKLAVRANQAKTTFAETGGVPVHRVGAN